VGGNGGTSYTKKPRGRGVDYQKLLDLEVDGGESTL